MKHFFRLRHDQPLCNHVFFFGSWILVGRHAGAVAGGLLSALVGSSQRGGLEWMGQWNREFFAKCLAEREWQQNIPKFLIV